MGRSELKKLLDEKKKAKAHVFSKHWPKLATSTVLLTILANDADRELVFDVLNGLKVLPIQVVIVCDSQPPDFTNHSGKFFWMNTENGRNQPKIDQFLLASDMALVFSEHQATLKKLFFMGAIPIAHEKSPLLENYHPNEESGNAFTFKSLNAWDIFSALVRANETYRFPFDWEHIIRGMLAVR